MIRGLARYSVHYTASSEFQCTKFTCKLLLELIRYWSKVNVFWNTGAFGFHMAKLIILFWTKIIVHAEFLNVTVSQSKFSWLCSKFWDMNLRPGFLPIFLRTISTSKIVTTPKNTLLKFLCAWCDFAQKCKCSWIFRKTQSLRKCLFSPFIDWCD